MALGQQQPIIAGVLDQPAPGLHQPLLQARQRPVANPGWATPAVARDSPSCMRSRSTASAPRWTGTPPAPRPAALWLRAGAPLFRHAVAAPACFVLGALDLQPQALADRPADESRMLWFIQLVALAISGAVAPCLRPISSKTICFLLSGCLAVAFLVAPGGARWWASLKSGMEACSGTRAHAIRERQSQSSGLKVEDTA